MQDVYVGRQPIYGRGLDVYAYEILFRSGDVDHADFVEGDRATSQVILNTFSEIGLDRVVGERLAFLNVTRGFIIGEYPLPVPHDRVVLEVLEDILPEVEVVEGLKELRKQGYTIALDDFVLTDSTEALLELGDIVKIDCLTLDPGEIQEQYELLKPYGLKLLAEKIETQDQFDACRSLGFEYFQGFFLSRPNVIRDRGLPTNHFNVLRLLAEMQDPNVSFDHIQELVSQDVALSYKFLRHINTAAFGLRREITSVHETVVHLGMKTVKSLASLFVLASIDDKPHDLIVTSMLRGKMCELLAARQGNIDPQRAFTVGLFSTLDAMMDAPMSSVLEKLPLTEELRAALLDRKGELGEALRSTVAYERGDWEAVPCLGLSRGEIKSAFLDAVEWVDEVDRDTLGLAA